MFFNAFRKLAKSPLLFMIPIVVDALSVLLGVVLHGFHGSPHFTLKFALQMGLPSISAVAEQTFMPGSVQIVGSNNATSIVGIFLFLILYLVVESFLKGGYVGLLIESGRERNLSMKKFVSYGKRFFGRFLMLDLLVLLFLFVLGGLTTVVLKMLGIVLFTLIFLYLRIRFLYLEFTLVNDDCSIQEAFSRSSATFRNRTSATLPLVWIAIAINVVAGIIVNALWQPFLFLVLLLIYDFIGAGLQLSFMDDFRYIKLEEEK